MLQFKVASLQRSLDESVPSADLEKYARDYKELAVKYRDMLQNDNKLVARNARMDELEVKFSFSLMNVIRPNARLEKERSLVKLRIKPMFFKLS